MEDLREDPTFEEGIPVPVEVYEIEHEGYIHFGVGRIIGSVETFLGRLPIVEVQDIKDGEPVTMVKTMDVVCETLRSKTVDFLAENLCAINSVRRYLQEKRSNDTPNDS